MKLLQGLQTQFKFYVDTGRRSGGPCTLAFIYRVPFTVTQDSSKLAATIRLQGVEPVDVDVCETPPQFFAALGVQGNDQVSTATGR